MGYELLFIMNVIELKERKYWLNFLRKVLFYVIIVFTSPDDPIYYTMLIGKDSYFLIDHDLLNVLIVISFSIDDVNIDQ